MKKQTMYAVYVKTNPYCPDKLVRCFSSKKLAEKYKKEYKKIESYLITTTADVISGELSIIEINLSDLYENALYNKRGYKRRDILKEIRKHKDLYVVNYNMIDNMGFPVNVLVDQEDVENIIIDDFRKSCKYFSEYDRSLSIFKIDTDYIDKSSVSVLIMLDIYFYRIFASIESERTTEFEISYDAYGNPAKLYMIIEDFTNIKDAVKAIFQDTKKKQEKIFLNLNWR